MISKYRYGTMHLKDIQSITNTKLPYMVDCNATLKSTILPLVNNIRLSSTKVS